MQHLPPGYVRVLEKIDEIGRAIYGNAWCGDQVAEISGDPAPAHQEFAATHDAPGPGLLQRQRRPGLQS